MTLVDLLGLLFAAVLSVQFVLYFRSNKIKRDYAVLRVLRGWKWVGAVLSAWVVILLVIGLGLVLIKLSPTVMGWSWLRLLARPGEAGSGRNLMVSGLTVPGFAWVFLGLLAFNVPRLAMNEEYAFRKGHKKPRDITFQSVKFGLAHCLVGVPIGMGLALSVAGGWFAVQYLRGGLRRSAAYHSLHNWSLLLLAALWLSGLLR